MTDMELKIVLTGPVGAGKTTAIDVLSEGRAVRTDVAASDAVALMKASTTVAMDYAEIPLGGDQVLHLYGTPGQARFDFMWELLGRGALGVIILLDASSPDAADDYARYAEAFSGLLEERAGVVGLTKTDVADPANLADCHHAVAVHPARLPAISVDARDRWQLLLLVEMLLCQLEAGEKEPVA